MSGIPRIWWNPGRLWWLVVSALVVSGCVNQVCFDDGDCPAEQICAAEGICRYQCTSTADCPAGFICRQHRCVPESVGPIDCPEDMVPVADAFCMDRFEASRPDATATDAGGDESRAVSRAGVLPWWVRPMGPSALGRFERACGAAGKRLCTAEEWESACRGTQGNTYFFGDSFNPEICNTVDTYCQACCDILGDVSSCPTEANCGYSPLLSSSPYLPETCFVTLPYGYDTCHVCFHLMPTGAFSFCTNDTGAYDVNGNLWEIVPVPASVDSRGYQVRGGAFNCASPATRLRCDYNAGWTDLYAGFRCCLTPENETDGGTDGGDGAVIPADASDGDGGGCVVEDGGEDGADGALDGGDVGQDDGEDGGQDGADGEPDGGDAGGEFDGGDPGIEPDAGDMEEDGADAGEPDAGEADGVDGGADGEPTGCPPDMVPRGTYCIDRYEASRTDATDTDQGQDGSLALSRPGVLPWYVNPMTGGALLAFEDACQAAGKRLCSAEEWFETCRGPEQSLYFWGDTWDPAICNTVDTFCQECCDILGDVSPCPTGQNCGYAAALSSSPYVPETCFLTEPYSRESCHVCFHVMPTGAFELCTNSTGAFDVGGNVWEAVPVPTSVDSRGYQLRGGAFNCGAPVTRLQCTFNATWTALYAGFRCCRDREINP